MDKVKCLRLYADPEGESHFGETEFAMKSAVVIPPSPPVDVSAPVPAARFMFVSGPPGYDAGLHPAPRKQLVVFLKGQFEFNTTDGQTRVMGPGDFVLVEDTTGRGHYTRVTGADDGLLLFVQLSD